MGMCFIVIAKFVCFDTLRDPQTYMINAALISACLNE